MSQRKPEGGDADPAQPIDRAPGTYLLILELTKCKVIQVGALGRTRFTAGWYAYAGSAFGPGGLAARINRHLMSAQKPHWHIDYLRTAARPKEVWVAEGPPSREHNWASALAESAETAASVPGFGCSDCRCRSHLFQFAGYPARDWLMKTLGNGANCIALRRTPKGKVRIEKTTR